MERYGGGSIVVSDYNPAWSATFEQERVSLHTALGPLVLTTELARPPLVSYRVFVDLISATTTKTGLTMRCELDTGQYPSGNCRLGRRDGRNQYQTRPIPRRVELHYLAECLFPRLHVYFLTGS